MERRDLIWALLPRIDPKARNAAIFYFVDEMTQEDAARAAGCSVPTLRKRLRAFVRAARKQLKIEDPSWVFGDMPL